MAIDENYASDYNAYYEYHLRLKFIKVTLAASMFLPDVAVAIMTQNVVDNF